MTLVPLGRAAAQQSTSNPGANQQQPPPKDPPLVNAEVQTPVIKVTKPKLDRYKGHVLVFNMASIVVQSDSNPKFIWSFQYSPELRAQVGEMLNKGGYRYGDKVQVYCNPGTTIAVKFKGKPSGSGSS